MIRLMIAGDLAIKNRTKDLLDAGDCDALFSGLKAIADQFDYRLLNLENPIVSGEGGKIDKIGPHLGCDEKVVDLLHYAQIDGVTLANNHFRDYGDQGVAHTLRVLDNHGIDHVGGGVNIDEASRIFYKKIGEETLAIINCTEHEFSIATPSSGGANPLNPIQQYYAIQEARGKADYVVVITHGGVEQYELPTPRMVETYRFFIDAGADAVVNHHQHCFSGYETYKGKAIFYGLGNLCFDYPNYRHHKWNKGFVVRLSLDKQSIGFKLLPYVQSDEKPGVVMLEEKDRGEFEAELNRINAVIADAKALDEAQKKWISRFGKAYSALLTPYSSRWTSSLFCRGLLPSLTTRQKWMSLLNKMQCESHRDNYIRFMKDKLGL